MSLSGRGPKGRLDGQSLGLGAVAGVLAAGAALGAGQFVAGLTGASGSPVVVVGELQIDFTPPWLKNFAISEFGADDKLVLVSGILVVLGVFAAVIGAAATRRMAYGMAGVAVFAVVGLTAAATRPDATAASLLPTLAATAAAVAVLQVLIPMVRPPIVPPPASAVGRAVSYDPVTAPAAAEERVETGPGEPEDFEGPPRPRGTGGDRGARGRGRAGRPAADRAEQRGRRTEVAAHPPALGHCAVPAARDRPAHPRARPVRHA